MDINKLLTSLPHDITEKIITTYIDQYNERQKIIQDHITDPIFERFEILQSTTQLLEESTTASDFGFDFELIEDIETHLLDLENDDFLDVVIAAQCLGFGIDDEDFVVETELTMKYYLKCDYPSYFTNVEEAGFRDAFRVLLEDITLDGFECEVLPFYLTSIIHFNLMTLINNGVLVTSMTETEIRDQLLLGTETYFFVYDSLFEFEIIDAELVLNRYNWSDED